MYDKAAAISQQSVSRQQTLLLARMPLDVFTSQLSPLATVIIHLRQQGYRFTDIAHVLQRKPSTISTTYYNAIKQHPQPLESKGGISVPIAALSDGKRTIAESITLHLHQEGYSNKEIATLLSRDNKAVWTTITRAKKKTPTKATSDEHLVPISIFAGEASPLQALTTHLHDNEHLTFTAIARTLGRQTSTIASSYQQAKDKRTPISPCSPTVPLAALARRPLTIAEALVDHLHREEGLRIATIAKLLNKDNRAVWTTKTRAEAKRRRWTT